MYILIDNKYTQSMSKFSNWHDWLNHETMWIEFAPNDSSFESTFRYFVGMVHAAQLPPRSKKTIRNYAFTLHQYRKKISQESDCDCKACANFWKNLKNFEKKMKGH